MRRAGCKELINKICLTKGDVKQEQVDALCEIMKELPYLEYAYLRHTIYGMQRDRIAKILEVPKSYLRDVERKAIRHLRTPHRYYSILMGTENYKKYLEKHVGDTPVTCCGFTTRTANTLKRNGFMYIEELWKYIGKVPERFTYIDGLGKYGMSEVMFYFYNKEVLKG